MLFRISFISLSSGFGVGQMIVLEYLSFLLMFCAVVSPLVDMPCEILEDCMYCPQLLPSMQPSYALHFEMRTPTVLL